MEGGLRGRGYRYTLRTGGKGATEDEMVGLHHQLKNLSKFREIVKDRKAWRAAVHGVAEGWTRLGD